MSDTTFRFKRWLGALQYPGQGFSPFSVTLLVGSYVVAQAIADVAATKMVAMGDVVMPAGTLIFALTFTLRDLLHRNLGKVWARAAIVCAGLFNVIQAGYLYWMAHTDSPPFFAYAEAWTDIFALVPSITIASIMAEVISELVDTEVFSVIHKRAPAWSAVLISNAVSLPLDSLLFATLGFTILPGIFGADSLPLLAALSLTAGQVLWKGMVTIVSLPTIYLVRKTP